MSGLSKNVDSFNCSHTTSNAFTDRSANLENVSKVELNRVDLVASVDRDSNQDSKFKFRHPTTRNELASYYLHFMGPKPFYKTYSYV